jgi:hypothetical protein
MTNVAFVSTPADEDDPSRPVGLTVSTGGLADFHLVLRKPPPSD